MPRLVSLLAGAAMLTFPAVSAAAAGTSPTDRRMAVSVQPAPTLVAFRSRFGFGSRSRGYGYGYRGYGRPRQSLLRRAAKTAIWLYVLHLFFTHGGLSILLWIVIIAVVLSLLRRRRRRLAY
jgi:hypothetical protein